MSLFTCPYRSVRNDRQAKNGRQEKVDKSKILVYNYTTEKEVF
jgi:hypothetical protein